MTTSCLKTVAKFAGIGVASAAAFVTVLAVAGFGAEIVYQASGQHLGAGLAFIALWFGLVLGAGYGIGDCIEKRKTTSTS